MAFGVWASLRGMFLINNCRERVQLIVQHSPWACGSELPKKAGWASELYSPWPLLQSLPPGSCLEFCPWLPSAIGCDLGVENEINPFFPKLHWPWCFISAIGALRKTRLDLIRMLGAGKPLFILNICINCPQNFGWHRDVCLSLKGKPGSLALDWVDCNISRRSTHELVDRTGKFWPLRRGSL